MDETETERTTDPRRSPLLRHVPLWIGFLLVVVLGVFTVLIPEITDEGEDEDAAATASDDDARAASTPVEPSATP